jgi:hypothetical protein
VGRRGDRDRLDVLGRHVRAAGQRVVAAGSRITASVPRGEAPTVALVSCGLRGLIPAVHQGLVLGEGPESRRGAALIQVLRVLDGLRPEALGVLDELGSVPLGLPVMNPDPVFQVSLRIR